MTKPGLFLDSGEFISADEINRWNGTVRETQPGELLPVSDDPAVGRNGRWYAVLAVIACAALANVLAQVWRA